MDTSRLNSSAEPHTSFVLPFFMRKSSELTSMLDKCPQIWELDLRNCQLTALPDELAELRTLKSVKLNLNQFSTFPSVLCSLPRLTVSLSNSDLPVLGTLTTIGECRVNTDMLLFWRNCRESSRLGCCWEAFASYLAEAFHNSCASK
eukprot:8013206-Pyramimonas_sp.AAC.1